MPWLRKLLPMRISTSALSPTRSSTTHASHFNGKSPTRPYPPDPGCGQGTASAESFRTLSRRIKNRIFTRRFSTGIRKNSTAEPSVNRRMTHVVIVEIGEVLTRRFHNPKGPLLPQEAASCWYCLGDCVEQYPSCYATSSRFKTRTCLERFIPVSCSQAVIGVPQSETNLTRPVREFGRSIHKLGCYVLQHF